MHDGNGNPIRDGRGSARRIASYKSFEGASLAAKQLIEAGHDPEDIIVVAGNLHDVRRRRRLPMRVALAALRLATVAAFVGVVAAALLASTAPSPARSVVLWLLAALGLATLVALLPTWAKLRGEQDGADVAPLAPDRFEVACAEDVDGARFQLARWWDPQAEPAPAPPRESAASTSGLD